MSDRLEVSLYHPHDIVALQKFLCRTTHVIDVKLFVHRVDMVHMAI